MDIERERSLVEQAKSEVQAFGLLYDAYYSQIYAYCLKRTASVSAAQDVTSEVFFNALKSIRQFRWRGVPFSAWLYRIAHNQVVDYFRKRKHVSVEIDESLPADADDPARAAEDRLEIERLQHAASRLTRAQQEVISLRFTSDLPIAEVARIMGKSEGAIKALQHSAIVALRKVMAVA